MVALEDHLQPLGQHLSVLAAVVPLSVHGLTVRFGPLRAVDGLDLVVGSGEVVGLVGPNGCGKTTTLRAVMGFAEPADGSVTVAGAAAGTIDARGRVSWAPDEPGGPGELTVQEFLALAGALYRADGGYGARCRALARGFGLEGRERVRLDALSHGLRRLVAIVAAVALDRALLVVDEATAALDPEAVIALRETLRAVARRGTGVLVATQDLGFAETACDRVVLLNAGSLVASGTVERLERTFAATTLEGVFVAAVGSGERLGSLRRVLDAL